MNRTPIEWTHWSVNPFKMRMPDGTLINVCIHKSDGCRFCYAEGIVRRWWKKEWGEFPGYTAALLKLGTPVLVEDELRVVLRLSERIAKGKADPSINKVFWNDMTDEYLEFWPDEFIDKCWAVRSLTPNLIHQVLTKRVDRLSAYFADPYHMNRARSLVYVYDQQKALHEAAASWPLPHAHIGVSVEDQKTADERIPLLLQTPAAARWISTEPLLGPVSFRAWHCACGWEGSESTLLPSPSSSLVCPKCGGSGGLLYRNWLFSDEGRREAIDWIVVGGESGPKARPMNLAWAHSVVRECQRNGVPVFVKQLGGNPVYDREQWEDLPQREAWILKDKKGGDIAEWPVDLQVREFPSVVTAKEV